MTKRNPGVGRRSGLIDRPDTVVSPPREPAHRLAEGSPASPADVSPRDTEIQLWIEQYLARSQGGEPNPEAWLQEVPEHLRSDVRLHLDALRDITSALGVEGMNDATRDGAAGADSPARAAMPRPGEPFGDFEVLRELGRGGMGVVYLARQRSLGRLVALKVLNARASASPRHLSRFRREAEAIARLNHPGIVAIHSVGQEQSEAYLVMEYIEGTSLATELDRARRSALAADAAQNAETTRPNGDSAEDETEPTSPGTVSPRTVSTEADDHGRLEGSLALRDAEDRTSSERWSALPTTAHGPAVGRAGVDDGMAEERPDSTIATHAPPAERGGRPRGGPRSREHYHWSAQVTAEVAEALGYAHERGVIHRDIKPANVLLDHQGRARIVDFGLAKAEDEVGLSISGEVLGTYHYMSPEQTEFVPGNLDRRSDVFSLGVVLYQMLTAQLPFTGASGAQIVRRIQETDPALVRSVNPEVPRDLETICHRALEKPLSRRYESADELAADLRRFLSHQAIHARPPSTGERVVRWVSRRRWALATSALLIGVAVAAVMFASYRFERQAVDERMVSIDAFVATPLATSVDFEVMLAVKRDIAVMRERYPGFVPEKEKTLARAEEAIRYRARRILDSVLPTIDPASAVAGESPKVAVNGLLEAFKGSLEAQRLNPDEALLSDLVFTDPEVHWIGVPPDAKLTVVGLDPYTSAVISEEEFERSNSMQFSPGYYRFVLSTGDRFGEYTRYVRWGQSIEIVPALRPTVDVTKDMVLIPGGDFVWGTDEPHHPSLAKATLSLPSFFLDTHEVTVAEYAEFLAATGHPEPPEAYWSERKSDWDNLPVTFVSWLDAQAYAEWRGKRLPTSREWEKAARGVDGRLFPWGDAAATAEQAQILQQGGNRSTEDYLRGVVPVTTGRQDVSPYGVFNLYGNVSEWTESIHTEFTRGDLVFRREVLLLNLSWRIIRGENWASPGDEITDLTGFYATYLDDTVARVGFRCAKSAP